MKEVKLSLLQSWVRITRLLIQLKKAWDKHVDIWEATPKGEIEMMPQEAQKFLSKNFNRSKFDIMLPRMVDYWRSLGGIEALEIKVKEEKEDK